MSYYIASAAVLQQQLDIFKGEGYNPSVGCVTMGCLIELFCEVVFEMFGFAYIMLMTMIIPKNRLAQAKEAKLRKFVTVYAIVLALAVVAGLLMLLFDNQGVNRAGGCIAYISAGLIVLQVIACTVVKLVTDK